MNVLEISPTSGNGYSTHYFIVNQVLPLTSEQYQKAGSCLILKFSAAGKNILERLTETDKTTSKGGSIKFHMVQTFEAVLIESFSYMS